MAVGGVSLQVRVRSKGRGGGRAAATIVRRRRPAPSETVSGHSRSAAVGIEKRTIHGEYAVMRHGVATAARDRRERHAPMGLATRASSHTVQGQKREETTRRAEICTTLSNGLG